MINNFFIINEMQKDGLHFISFKLIKKYAKRFSMSYFNDSYISKHKKEFEDAGFIFQKSQTLEIENAINNTIRDMKNAKLTRVSYKIIKTFAKPYYALTNPTLKNYKYKFEDAGFEVFIKQRSLDVLITIEKIIQDLLYEKIKYINYIKVSTLSKKYSDIQIAPETIKNNYKHLFENAGLVFESRSERTDRKIIEIIEKMQKDGLEKISYTIIGEYAKKLGSSEGITYKVLNPRRYMFEKTGLRLHESPDVEKIEKQIDDIYRQQADFSHDMKSQFIDRSKGEFVIFVKEFPRINLTGKYLILEKYKDSFEKFYRDAVKKMFIKLGNTPSVRLQDNSLSKDIISRGAWEELETIINEDRQGILKYRIVQETLITEKQAHFNQLDGWRDYFAYIDGNNPFPMRKKRSKTRHFKDMTGSYSLIAEFIILPLVKKGMMLTPLYGTNLYFTKSHLVNKYISDQFHHQQRYKEIYQVIQDFFPGGLQRHYIYQLVMLSTTISLKDFTNEDIEQLKNYYRENKIELGQVKKTTKVRVTEEDSYGKTLLRGLAKFLLKAGADVNSLTTAKAKAKTIDDVYKRITRLKNDPIHKNNINLIEDAEKFIRRIYNVDELAIGTMDMKVTHLMNFFVPLSEQFKGEKVTRNMIELFLDYPDGENTFQHRLKRLYQNGKSSELLISIQGTVIDFLDSTKEFYGAYKNNTRVKFKKRRTKSTRKSLDREVYDLILDIVMNRPPLLDKKKWGTKIVDWSSWWPHKIVPFLPLALYLHLYLPLRSAHILNLDRDNFLIKNADGSIRSFWINTDKDTTRKEEHIIPNIYKSSLNIIDKLIELNKEMYPNLKKHKYQHDKNSPWEEFYPLFPNEHGDRVLHRDMYVNYFKRVVMKAQVELYIQGSNKKIAWFKNGNDIPKTSEEVDALLHEQVINIDMAFNLHTLRVTGATRLMQMGLPPQMIKYFTGHKSIDVLINIYIKIPDEELIESFFAIQDKIDTSTIHGLEKYHKKIPESIIHCVGSENPKEIHKAMIENNLFTMDRYAFRHDRVANNKEFITNGLELISEVHWSFWKAETYGICGKPEACPFGANARCSLCPYLVTGPLYFHGIAAKTEEIQRRVFVTSNDIAKNRKEGNNNNMSLQKQQEVDIEELAGWYEILEKCKNCIEDKVSLSENSNDNSLLIKIDKSLSILQYESVDEIDGLAHIFQRAKALKVNNSDIRDATYALSAQAIKWCMQNHKVKEIQSFMDQPEKVIEWFLPQRTKELENKNMFLPEDVG